jgi:hypothetical protein
MWTEDKTDATQQNSPDSQSLLLGLLTGQTIVIGRRGAGSRRTRRRSTRWRRTGRRRANSVSSRRGDRALANYYRARGRSYYFTWITFHRGARTTIRQRRRSRTSGRFRRPVRHWSEFAGTGGGIYAATHNGNDRNSGDRQKSTYGNEKTSTQLHTLQGSPKGLRQNPRYSVPNISIAAIQDEQTRVRILVRLLTFFSNG